MTRVTKDYDPGGGVPVRRIYIEPEKPKTCELCSKVAETRPYGPGGKQICFECGEKDKAGTEQRVEMCLFGKVLKKDKE